MNHSDWSNRRVFITGATGMVGSWLTRKILDQRGYVVVLVRDWNPKSELIRSGTIQRVNVVQGDLQDFQTLERAINENEIDTIFHLGAQPIVGTAFRNPLNTFETNIRGTYNLMESCRIHSDMVKRVVVASSDKAYGAQSNLPYTEDSPLLGRHSYDVSKACADLIAQSHHHTYDLPVAIARCGNIYGGGDLNWSRIVPGTIKSLLNDERPQVRSDGRFIRDYVYVKDAIEAYISIAVGLDKPETHGEAFNFGPERPVTVLEIVSKISKLLDREDLEPLVLNQAKSEIREQYLSSEKAKKFLGWRPKYSLEEGLQETIAWYKPFLGF